MRIVREQMNGHMTKFHLYDVPYGAVQHTFTGADGPHADFHDHPWGFETHIAMGGYEEEVLDPATGETEFFTRGEGDVVRNEAATTHRIIRLLEPTCITFIIPGPCEERKWGFYQRREDGVWHRFHDSPEWRRC